MLREATGRAWGRARAVAVVVLIALVASTISVLVPTAAAYAAGTVLFQNSFANRTVDGTGTVTKPTATSGTNVACLTASGNSATLPLLSCAGSADAQGSGKLRLTDSTANQLGGVFGKDSFPTSNGLDVTFTAHQWGGGGADGISFMLAAVDPANPAAPTTIGPSGGSLGYSPAGSVRGLPNAYLGIGLDVFGNFSSSGFSGTGCTNPPNLGAAVSGAVVARGPGNGLAGYCGLTTTYNGTTASKVALRAATRAASAVPVQVLVNPTGASFTSDSGQSVAGGTYKVIVNPVGQAARTLSGPLPAVAPGLYPATTWLTAAGVPKQLAFAFVGSTGGTTDNHEISNARVLTFNPVPQLAVATTSYSAPTSGPGAPVTYQVAGSVLPGANVTSPVSVTHTVPTGVVPAGAYGAGWVCAAPVGRAVTCTTSASSFTGGTALPALTVVAIVTGASVSAAVVQSSSTTVASSTGATSATDSTMTPGTLPAAPTGVAISPAIGPTTGGGVTTVTGSSSVPGTAVLIGTAAELQAGRPVVLLPCPGARAVGCFAVEGTAIVIASMPGRATPATVGVTVVTLGVASATSYVYVSSPAAPATPTATAGISSAALTWAAPADNGSAITGYVVTPYLGGVAQAPQTFAASPTTHTFTGLTPGGSYTYTVAATNAYGTSAPSARSAAVVPYTLPGAPVFTAATAGSQAAVLSWSAPNDGGSAITGYVVTPYVGAVAQTPQAFDGSATTATVTGLTAGTAYTFRVAAQNLAGTGPQSAASAVVTPNRSPGLAFAAPPAGQVGVAYSRQLTVTDGTAPFTWSISAGTLPAGLTLNASTGLLSGTPTAAGSSPVTVRVVDASGQAATRAVTLVVAAAPAVAFTPAAGEVGVPYSQQPTLTGGTGPFAWRVSAGSLPAGVTIGTTTGLVSGTPTASGTFSVTVTATDSFGQAASATATLVVVAAPAFTAAAPPAGQVGVAYSHTFAVTGGSLPLTWSISAGSAPAGLTFAASTGVLSGTPTTVGSSPFTVSVVDANSQSAAKPVTVVIGAGPLVIAASANATSVTAGSVVAHTVTVTNTGTTASTGVTWSAPLTGVLDDAVYNGDVSATAGTASYSAPDLGWTGNVAAGGTVTITYSVTVDDPDVGNKVLTTTVTSPTLGTNCAAAGTDARCTVTVTVAGLTIVKTAGVATTTPGSTVGFQVVITNTGQTAYPAATFTDDLAGVLDDGVYGTAATATTGSLVYTVPSLTWTGALAPGASATIRYTVTVADPDLGDRSLTGTVTSASAGSPCPGGNPAPSCTATVTVLVPALSITNTASVATTSPGGVVGYTVTMRNTGQTPYTGTSVTIAGAAALDDAVYGDDVTTSTGSVAPGPDGTSVVWTGDLAVGASATVTFSTTVRNPDPGDRTMTIVVSSAAAGSTCPVGATAPACTSTVRVLVPGLTIARSTDVGTTTPGSVVRYTVSVTNSGQTPYAGATVRDALGGVLDDALYNGDATATAGAVSVTGSTLTWSGDLAVAASATITYSVTVNDPDTGDRTLVAAATSTSVGSNCPVGGTAPECSSSVTVLLPGLSIVGTLDATTAVPGQVVRSAVTVTNTGQTAYTAIPLTLHSEDLLDDSRYNNDLLVSTGDLAPRPDGTVTWTLNLAPGATATITTSVTVNDPPTGNKDLRIFVTADVPGSSCPTGSTDPGCSVRIPVLVPGLTITKTADATTVEPGGTVGYTVTVRNDGETTFPAAEFSDSLDAVLPDAVYADDATASSGTVVFGSPVLSWTGALAPGATATVTYSVTVRDPDPGDKLLTNTAVSASAGSNCAAGRADPRCTAVVQVLVPGLTIAATASPPTTTPGAVVDHTVTLTNSGDTRFTGASSTVQLGGVLDDADYNGDAAAGTGTVGYAASTLTWTGDLAPGASTTVTYSVTVHAADDGDDLVTAVVSSAVPGSNCAAGSPDGRCATTVPVARLVLAVGEYPPTATPGSRVTFPGTFTNTGQVPYVGISVDVLAPDAVDDTLSTGDRTASSGTLTVNATGATWSGSIPVGGVVTLGGTLLVKDPPTGDGLIRIRMQSAAPGSNCPPGGTDSACILTVTVVVPGLTITKTASTTAAAPGTTVGYTVTVTNTGETPYTAVPVVDQLGGVVDKATYNADATTSRGTVAYSAPTLTWTGDLAPGASATITYSVTVRTAPTVDKTLVNRVGSTAVGSTCAPASTDAACSSVVSVLTPALTVVATADTANATLGTTVTYSVTATNTGQTPYPAASFTAPLAGVLDDATPTGPASATRGTVGSSGGVLTWTGALDPGESATVGYTVTVNNPASGDRIMSTTATSTTSGANCGAGSADPGCTASVQVTDALNLTFTRTAGAPTTVAGAVVAYTVTVANAARTPVAAQYTDSLAGVLDDADYNGDAVASTGTVVSAGPDLTWTGTVPAQSTATVTYSVTVRPTITGDEVLVGTVSSTSTPASNNCLAGSGDSRCTNAVAVAALLLTQTAAEPTTTPGSAVRIVQTFTNTGAVPYFGISVVSPRTDTADDTVPTGDQTATSGTLVRTDTTLTWTGDIPVGATVTTTRTLVVKNPDTGNEVITATLESTAPGNNCPTAGPDPRCTFLVTVLTPALTLTKSADTTRLVPGATAGYTITVRNTGESAYVGATVSDTLAGVLDDAVYDAASLTTTSGTVAYAAPVLTWTGDLAAGASATITYSVTALSPAPGDKTMVNAVSSTAAGSTCPPDSGNAGCRSTVAVLTPALTITSAVSAPTTVPGATVGYTVTATNTGQTPYSAADLFVPLAGVLDDATVAGPVTASSGTAALTGGGVAWTGALNPGATTTISFAVTAAPAAGGDHRLDHTVTSATQGSNCPVAGTDPRCSSSVLIASLRILSTTDVSTTQPTRVVRNTITYTNTGQVPYVGISIGNDLVGSLDDATYNGDVATTSGSLAFGTTGATWSGDVPVGGVVTVTGSFTVNDPDLGDQHLTTLVTTDAAATDCPTGAPGPGCSTDVLVLTPGLTITKSAGAATANPGSPVEYTITVRNSGATPYTGAVVRDSFVGVLNDATYAGGAVATSGAVTFASPVLTWTGDLTVGQTVVITYTVQVNDPDLGDKAMVNRVTSDEVGSTCPTGGSAPACTTLVTVLVPALDIAVTADRTTAVPGSAVGYTVTIRNTGQVPYTGANVTTQLAGVLDDAAYAGGATTTSGSVSSTGPDLTWTGDLAVGATAVVAYSVTVADPDTGDRILATTVTSGATGSTCGAAEQCANSVTVLIPGLAVSTTADVATATPGDRVVFTITVANTGQTPYTGTVVSTALTDVLDDATVDGAVTATRGLPTYDAPNLSWTGALAVGESATITYTATVRTPDTGDRRMTTTLLAPAAGSTCRADSTDPACTATVTVLVPALSISKTAGAPTTVPGGTVDYTIIVTNTGEADYTGAVVTDSLAGLLVDAAYDGDAAVTGGGVLGYAEPVLTWTGDLLVGATATITYSIVVDDPDNGDKVLANAVTSTTPGSTCPPGGTAPACTTLVRVLVPALTVTKTADAPTVTAGDAVRYTVTLTNTGETPYAPATFTDPLADVLDDAAYAGDATSTTGTVAYSNGTLAWSGPLAVGATATVTYSVTTRFPAAGDRLLVNTVVSASAGSTCVDGADPGCRSEVTVLVPALTITKTTGASEVVAGGTLDYTVSATNTGEADYPAAALTDSLAGVLDDAVYNGDATATTGAVTDTAGVLGWTGALPVGATVVIGYSVTANTTGPGDGVLTNQVGSTSTGSTCGPGATAPPCVTTTPVAARTLTLTDLTPSFTLTGLPDSTVSTDGAVTMTVTTNSPGGYLVSVQPATGTLTGAVPGNTETIPIGQVGVRETGTEPFRRLSDLLPLTVHRQDTPSAPDGDAVSNDYQVEIPFVPSDTYSAELDYIVSAQ